MIHDPVPPATSLPDPLPDPLPDRGGDLSDILADELAFAWGQRAAVVALRAAHGHPVTRADLIALAEAHGAMIPACAGAARALLRFQARLSDGPVMAGGGFRFFLDHWRGGMMRAEIVALEAGLDPVIRPCAVLSMDLIAEIAADVAGVSVVDLIGPSRPSRVAHARQMAMAAMRDLMGCPLQSIGAFFGREHTTVIYGLRAFRARLHKSSRDRGWRHAFIVKLADRGLFVEWPEGQA